jgi:hypothetical protein
MVSAKGTLSWWGDMLLICSVISENESLILKLYNTLILHTFLYGSENWTLTASQRRRIEASEMKLLRPLAGYTFCDHKTNSSIRQELRITIILGKKDEYRKKWLLHIQIMPQNRIVLKSYNYRTQGIFRPTRGIE